MKTQAGKKLRKLTKHQDLNIKASAAEMLNVWKGVVSSEAAAVEEGTQQLGVTLLQPLHPAAIPCICMHLAESAANCNESHLVEP